MAHLLKATRLKTMQWKPLIYRNHITCEWLNEHTRILCVHLLSTCMCILKRLAIKYCIGLRMRTMHLSPNCGSSTYPVLSQYFTMPSFVHQPHCLKVQQWIFLKLAVYSLYILSHGSVPRYSDLQQRFISAKVTNSAL